MNSDKPVGVSVGERLKQQAVDRAENRRRDADAQTQAEHGDDREAGGPSKEPNAVSKVLEELLDGGPAPHGARGLFHEREVAELAPRVRASGIGRLTPLDAIASRQVEMRLNLRVQVVVATAAPESPRHRSDRVTPSRLGRVENAGHRDLELRPP